jgi:hypothetical protein
MMKLGPLQINRNEIVILVVGVLVIGLFLKKTLSDAGQAINPVNPDNVFNRTFNSVYRAVTGSRNTLGEDIADWRFGGK